MLMSTPRRLVSDREGERIVDVSRDCTEITFVALLVVLLKTKVRHPAAAGRMMETRKKFQHPVLLVLCTFGEYWTV